MATESSSEGTPTHPKWEHSECLNHYGDRIMLPELFNDLHYPKFVPLAAGDPPVCSCGWTRFRVGDHYVELCEHIHDMGESGTMNQHGVTG